MLRAADSEAILSKKHRRSSNGSRTTRSPRPNLRRPGLAFITWLDSPYFKPITTKGQTNGKRDGEAERACRAGERWAARAVDFGRIETLLPTISAGQPSELLEAAIDD